MSTDESISNSDSAASMADDENAPNQVNPSHERSSPCPAGEQEESETENSGRTVPTDLTIRRRRLVATLSLRGMPPSDIYEEVAAAGICHDDGSPFSLRTIYNDLSFLEQNVYSQTIEDAGRHRKRVLAELREVKRQAWQCYELGTVLKAIKQETDLCKLVIEEPQKPVPPIGPRVSNTEFDEAFHRRATEILTYSERRTYIKLLRLRRDVLGELLDARRACQDGGEQDEQQQSETN